MNKTEWVRDLISREALGTVTVEFQILMEVMKENNIKTQAIRQADLGFIRKWVHRICQFCPVYQTAHRLQRIFCLRTVAKLDWITPWASNFAVSSALKNGMDYRTPKIPSNLNYSVVYAVVFSLSFSTCTDCSGPK